MYVREENILESIASGACLSCKEPVRFEEVWVDVFLYKEGTCGKCGKEHHVCIRRM